MVVRRRPVFGHRWLPAWGRRGRHAGVRTELGAGTAVAGIVIGGLARRRVSGPASLDIPGVQFVDQRRKPNQRLMSFLVLGQTDIENARQFTVRLNLEGEDLPQLVKYNILGRDPVWVFRLDDYEMFAHWEHDMDAPAPGPVEKANVSAKPAPAN